MLLNPLPQSDAYARTLRALGTDVNVGGIGETGRCLIQTRRFPLLGPVSLISRGPVGVPPAQAADYLNRLVVKGPLIINTADRDMPLRGIVRLAAPRAVALLHLSDPGPMRARLHQNWRNALKQAERGTGHITNTSYRPEQHAWLLDAHRAQQRDRGYRALPRHWLDTFAVENPGQARVVTAFDTQTPIAAMLFLCHHPWATYHLGVTTQDGRRAHAHNLTLWHAMLWLSRRGYTTLDLGLLTGPESLDRFKLRTGAERHDLGGTWLRLPRPFRRQFPSIQVPSGQKA